MIGAALSIAIYLAIIVGSILVLERLLVLVGIVGSGASSCPLPLATSEALFRCFIPAFLQGAILGAKWGVIIGGIWGLASGVRHTLRQQQ